MKYLFLIGFLVLGCKPDHGFSPSDGDVDNVEGNGAIELSPESIVFTDMEVGATYSDYLKATSTGENNLEIEEIRILNSGGGVFYMEEKEDLVLAPGTSKEFTITATLAEATLAEGSLRIKSNDLDMPVIEYALQAVPLGGDPQDTGDEQHEDTGAD